MRGHVELRDRGHLSGEERFDSSTQAGREDGIGFLCVLQTRAMYVWMTGLWGEYSHDRRLCLIARLSLLRHTLSLTLSLSLFCNHMCLCHLSISDEGREGEKVISITLSRESPLRQHS